MSESEFNSERAIITCAVTGVLTNPEQHPVPVTVEQMAASAKEAFDAGAVIMHLHYRNQSPGLGHMPTWEPEICAEITQAVREACPGVIINMSTGVMGLDVSGPVEAMKRVRPEIAACNAGSLNYLKVRRGGTWAWPPLTFDNPVSKVQAGPLRRHGDGHAAALQLCDGGGLGHARRSQALAAAARGR